MERGSEVLLNLHLVCVSVGEFPLLVWCKFVMYASFAEIDKFSKTRLCHNNMRWSLDSQ